LNITDSNKGLEKITRSKGLNSYSSSDIPRAMKQRKKEWTESSKAGHVWMWENVSKENNEKNGSRWVQLPLCEGADHRIVIRLRRKGRIPVAICILIVSGNKQRLNVLSTLVRSNENSVQKLQARPLAVNMGVLPLIC
jgi:hypothetical protein